MSNQNDALQERRKKFRRIKTLRRRRNDQLVGHVCVPQYRGAGHAYAYCNLCGRALTQFPQRAHDLAQQLIQIAQAPIEKTKMEVTP